MLGERFKDLLNSCQHHGFEIWRLIIFFYKGLCLEMYRFVDTMCDGEFLDKTSTEPWNYFDHLSKSSQSWKHVELLMI